MIKGLKQRLRQAASYVHRDKPALLTFLFHSIFRDQQEIDSCLVDPQQSMTVACYRQFIEYFLEAGYQFISPDDLHHGLEDTGRYILATFDDGYYNNSHVLPLLRQYQTPATFFIATYNVIHNQCFWWDVLYRELSQQSLTKPAISKIQKKYKRLGHEQIIAKLKREFGELAMQPHSDVDRPFTATELQAFAQQDFVHIGNHTSEHFILDNYPAEIQAEQIQACQQDLNKLLGIDPKIISYPNGNYNDDTISISKRLGFDFGITVDKRKNYLPLASADKLVLGRNVLWANQPLKMQCDIFRSDIGLGRYQR